MVQVDVFWSYGFGAALAAAAGPRLAKDGEPFFGPTLCKTVLFLALAWAPTGMLLLLRHPSWETMQVAPSLGAIPPWLVLAFGVTNVTQGILGFALGRALLRAGKTYEAELNWVAAYIGFYFLLVYGWDGLAYDRFLYDRDMLAGSPAWYPGVATSGTPAGIVRALSRFFGSSVALTLYEDGAWLLPPFFLLYAGWIRENAVARGRRVAIGRIVALHLRGVFVMGLGSALALAFFVAGVSSALGVPSNLARAQGLAEPHVVAHVVSYLVGLPLGLAVLWMLLYRPGRLFHRWLEELRDPRAILPRRAALA